MSLHLQLQPQNALTMWPGWTYAVHPEQLKFGQILPEEGVRLREAAASVPEGLCIAEIGSYTGKSTMCLARGSYDGAQVPVYAIDLWDTGASTDGADFRVVGDERQCRSKYHRSEVRDIFNKRVCGLAGFGGELIRPIQNESSIVAGAWMNGMLGLLFIDGDHTEMGVRSDLDSWLPYLADDGVLALHDYKDIGAVKPIVDSMDEWAVRSLTGSLIVLARGDKS